MKTPREKHPALLSRLKDPSVKKVKVAVTDIDGVLRGKYLRKEKFLAALDDGFGFCNVVFGWDSSDACYDNSQYTGWHTGYPDAQAKIDLSTYRQVPWDDKVPFFLGDFEDGAGKAGAGLRMQWRRRCDCEHGQGQCGAESESGETVRKQSHGNPFVVIADFRLWGKMNLFESVARA